MQPDDVDAAMKAGRTLVSIYPVPSTTSDPGQVMHWGSTVVSAPAPGMSTTVNDDGFTLVGAPNAGDYGFALRKQIGGSVSQEYVWEG